MAGGGFGTKPKNKPKAAEKAKRVQLPVQQLPAKPSKAKSPPQAAPKAASLPPPFKCVGTAADLFPEGGRTIRVAELSPFTLCLYKWKGRLHASDAFSTAYKFPLVDADVFDGPTGPSVRVPLDGTEYSLLTGAVEKWCPTEGGSLMRGLLGQLKKNQPQTPLKVYETQLTADGGIWVKMQ